MRGFECYIHHKSKKGFIRHYNTSCYGSIRYYEPESTIYISGYDQRRTRKYQKLLIGLINEITPCELVTTKRKVYNRSYSGDDRLVKTSALFNTKFISFKLLGTYNQSLVLLNFVRNLWYSSPDVHNYSVKFFKTLEKLDEKEPLRRLTKANIEACKKFGSLYGGDHCNVHIGLKVRTVSGLLKYDGRSVGHFLTGGR